MDKSIKKGKNLVLIIIITILVISGVSTAIISSLYAAMDYTDIEIFKLLQGIFRLIIEGILLFFLYKGHTWAKWILIVLLLISGGYALSTLIAKPLIPLILLLGSIYLLLAVLLIASTDIKAYLKHQQKLNRKK